MRANKNGPFYSLWYNLSWKIGYLKPMFSERVVFISKWVNLELLSWFRPCNLWQLIKSGPFHIFKSKLTKVDFGKSAIRKIGPFRYTYFKIGKFGPFNLLEVIKCGPFQSNSI